MTRLFLEVDMETIRLSVNGRPRQVVVDGGTTLLDVLRDDLRLMGAKRACDDAGQCGACAVLVKALADGAAQTCS